MVEAKKETIVHLPAGQSVMMSSPHLNLLTPAIRVGLAGVDGLGEAAKDCRLLHLDKSEARIHLTTGSNLHVAIVKSYSRRMGCGFYGFRSRMSRNMLLS